MSQFDDEIMNNGEPFEFEEGHGLGDARKQDDKRLGMIIPTHYVNALDDAMSEAAQLATRLGVSEKRFIQLCKAAFEVSEAGLDSPDS